MHNTALYDAVLAAIGACNSAWIADPIRNGITPPVIADYTPAFNAAVAIATEVDDQIGNIFTGATISQRVLLESIVKSIMIGRSPSSLLPNDYHDVAFAIAEMFTVFSNGLQNSSTGTGGGGSFTNLTNFIFSDANTSVPLQTGNIEAPFVSLTQSVAALPNGGTVMLVPGDYSLEPEVHPSASAETAIVNFAGATHNQVFPLNAIVPPILSSNDLTLIGVETNAVTTSGQIRSFGCDHTTTLIATSVVSDDCIFRGLAECRIVTDGIFNSCEFNPSSPSSPIVTAEPGAFVQFRNCTFFNAPIVDFTGSGGVVNIDSSSYDSFLTAGGTFAPSGVLVNVEAAIPKLKLNLDAMRHSIMNFQNASSVSYLALTSDVAVAFDPFVFDTALLAPLRIFTAIFGLICGVIQDSDHGINGQMDIEVGVTITTDSGGIWSIVPATLAPTNVAKLPASLLGATFTWAASAGGLTVTVTRTPGVDSHAWWTLLCREIRDVTTLV